MTGGTVGKGRHYRRNRVKRRQQRGHSPRINPPSRSGLVKAKPRLWKPGQPPPPAQPGAAAVGGER